MPGHVGVTASVSMPILLRSYNVLSLRFLRLSTALERNGRREVVVRSSCGRREDAEVVVQICSWS